MIKEENKNLDYWKANAEEDYMQVPISVLRYISELETAVKNCSIPDVVNRRELLLGFYDWYLGQNPRLQKVKEQVIDEFLDQ